MRHYYETVSSTKQGSVLDALFPCEPSERRNLLVELKRPVRNAVPEFWN